MPKQPYDGPLQGELKYYVCLFKMEGHRTYRALIQSTVEACEEHLRKQLGKNKVTSKKFFEIDRIEGTFEEF